MKKILIAYALMLTLCTSATVSGVYLLYGAGWALVALGAFLFGVAEILRRGLKGMMRDV